MSDFVGEDRIRAMADTLSQAEERYRAQGNHGAADSLRYAREALEWSFGGADSPLMDEPEDPEGWRNE